MRMSMPMQSTTTASAATCSLVMNNQSKLRAETRLETIRAKQEDGACTGGLLVESSGYRAECCVGLGIRHKGPEVSSWRDMTKLTLEEGQIASRSGSRWANNQQQQADRPRSGDPGQPQRRGKPGKTKGIRQYGDDGRDNGPANV